MKYLTAIKYGLLAGIYALAGFNWKSLLERIG
jgi:hypothetical protein